MGLNIDALTSMEDTARKILSMSNDQQAEFFKVIEEKVDKQTSELLKKTAALFDMFTNKDKYDAISRAVGGQLYAELH